MVLFHYKSSFLYLLTSRNRPFGLFFLSLNPAHGVVPAAHSTHTQRTHRTGGMPRAQRQGVAITSSQPQKRHQSAFGCALPMQFKHPNLLETISVFPQIVPSAFPPPFKFFKARMVVSVLLCMNITWTQIYQLQQPSLPELQIRVWITGYDLYKI